MQIFLQDFRKYSPWLAFLVSLVLVLLALLLTLWWPVESGALAEEPQSNTFSMWGDYQSPQRCRECHETEFQMWTNTVHAKASFDPIFQTYLQQVQQPGECFACHATGYDTNTGQFVLAGVTCEACHGPYRQGHPQESMTIATSAGLCGSCHPSTLHEWEASQHGAADVTCIDCHEVHTQQTHAAAATNELCADCHQEQTQNETHLVHNNTNIHCVDCHLARPKNDDGSAMKGQAVTGHSFAVFVKTCNDCHPDSVSTVITP